MAETGVRRFVFSLLVALFAASSLTNTAVRVAFAGSTAVDLLPDLQMAPTYGYYLEQTPRNQLRLHFGTLVDNVGDGPLIVKANKRQGKYLTHVFQRIRRADGTMHTVDQPLAQVYFENRGVHDHYHLVGFIGMRLFSLDAPTDPPTDRRAKKIGFCLIDTDQMSIETRPPNWAEQTFNDCGDRNDRRVRMGISVGWGDVYQPYYAYQWIDFTGLPAGNYRLCSTVNPDVLWQEKSLDNDTYFADLTIDPVAKTVAFVAEGTGACEPTPPPPTVFD